MPFYNHTEILEKTNGGIDIITFLVPEAENALQRRKHFKIREEKTASCSIKRNEQDGNYIVTDWGTGDHMNAVTLWMNLKGVEYKVALEQISAQFGIMPEEQLKELRQPDFNKRPAKPDEEDGTYAFDIMNEVPEAWLKELGHYAKVEKLKFYHWHAVRSYTYIKDRVAMTFGSRDTYPIFIIEEEGFKKIYQPLAFEKRHRFKYAATNKPTDLIHGLQQAEQWFYERNPHEADGYVQTAEAAEENGGEPPKTEKIPELIICSGDRDALNVAGMGYYVVWKNSESAKITGKDYKRMSKIAERIYNLPDIDTTGVKQGHALAMYYMDIHTIWLPKELLERKDWRGNSRKDLVDFCATYRDNARSIFRGLLRISYPMRFWDVIPHDKGIKYEVNNVHLYNFLARNGFYRYEVEGHKEGFIYVQIEGNVVKEIDTVKTKAYINKFLEERREEVKLRNHFYRSPHLNASSLTNLPTVDPDFVSYTRHDRFFFYRDSVVKVSGEGIEQCKPGTVNKFVWEDNVIDHKIEIRDPFFKVDHIIDENGRQHINDIEILDDSCLFFRYLIQTSRIHWRKELEDSLVDVDQEKADAYRKKNRYKIDGPNLSAEEIHEQKLHLINKMYAIGYILHRYRQMSRAWCVYAMDNRISDSGESYGGSGKSILFNAAIGKMCRLFYKGARDHRIFEDRHVFDGVTKHTDVVLFDDAGEYLNFDFLFPYITGGWNINPKNNQPFFIPFSESPIPVITTNYTLRKTDPSTLRRVLFTVFSDYYHKEGEHYDEDMNPEIDFGKELLGPDYTAYEWNNFYNTMMQCLQLYLQLRSKVDPPMDNVTMRNLRTEMGDTFYEWALVYFSPEGDNLNKELVKNDVMARFFDETKSKTTFWSSQRFTRCLKAFCMHDGLAYNPQKKGKRIISKVDGKTQQMIFLMTPEYNVIQQNFDFKPDDENDAGF